MSVQLWLLAPSMLFQVLIPIHLAANVRLGKSRWRAVGTPMTEDGSRQSIRECSHDAAIDHRRATFQHQPGNTISPTSRDR
jgi:hypothetical protein